MSLALSCTVIHKHLRSSTGEHNAIQFKGQYTLTEESMIMK